jgi:hypothetical protein
MTFDLDRLTESLDGDSGSDSRLPTSRRWLLRAASKIAAGGIAATVLGPLATNKALAACTVNPDGNITTDTKFIGDGPFNCRTGPFLTCSVVSQYSGCQSIAHRRQYYNSGDSACNCAGLCNSKWYKTDRGCWIHSIWTTTGGGGVWCC